MSHARTPRDHLLTATGVGRLVTLTLCICAAVVLLSACDTPVGTPPSWHGTYLDKIIITNSDGGGLQVIRDGPPIIGAEGAPADARPTSSSAFLRRGDMANVPMTRTRALVIVAAPQNYAPSRVRDAANYLLMSQASTEEERRLATDAIEWLRSKRDEPKPAAVKPKLKR